MLRGLPSRWIHPKLRQRTIARFGAATPPRTSIPRTSARQVQKRHATREDTGGSTRSVRGMGFTIGRLASKSSSASLTPTPATYGRSKIKPVPPHQPTRCSTRTKTYPLSAKKSSSGRTTASTTLTTITSTIALGVRSRCAGIHLMACTFAGSFPMLRLPWRALPTWWTTP